MPDMEKRLEAFVRIAHGIVIFPGGVGTAEAILFLLGVLLHPDNADIPVPVVMTGPESSAEYFARIDEFIGATLGPDAQKYYRIEIGDSVQCAQLLAHEMENVKSLRYQGKDAFYFNWRLRIDATFQQPFVATHESMAALDLRKDQQVHSLALNLRRAFSGLVTGNIKEHGIRAIEAHGPFEISGDKEIMSHLDKLLSAFVRQQRMRLAGATYQPCYRLVT